MNSTRGVIACALVAVIVFGPLTDALGQQPVAPPAAPPAVVVETVSPEPAPARGRDIYDVGAGVVTVAKAPFTAALCAAGVSVGFVLFVLTFGSGYRASTRAIEEGCAQKWIVSGDDLRPRVAPGIFQDRSSDSYRDRR